MSIDTTVPGGELLAQLAAGEFSATDLVQAHLDRIAGPGAVLNAFTLVDADGALTAAKEVDRARAAGEPLGPLAGLPISVKDSVDVAGLRSTHGRLSDAYVATVDAPAVRRLREAGCVVLGKTNLPVYLSGHESANETFGRTLNPWDLQRSSGGSSGGASAAVAGGLAVADLGSDLAGSLRMPAAWCGLSGHRPSNGVVSKLGNLPWPPGGLLEPQVSAIGPITRTAADAAAFFAAMAGPEGPEAVGWRLELPPARATALAGVRVGVWLDDEACPVDAETRSAITGLADALERAGAVVAEFTDPPVAGHADLELFCRLQAGEVVHGFDEERFAEHVAAAAAGSGFSRAVTATHRQVLADWEAQRAAMARWARRFEDVDVVLAPAVPRTATRYGEDVDAAALVSWNRLTSIGKLPSTVLALGPGAESGLPVGVQVLGPYLEDHTPLTFAVLAEAAGLAGWKAPAPWT
ncbi:amidase family protein [Kineococcus rhizosphaerae]|uniref:Amidase n=1 Tax=Kineococcus rhizosphaerae TaxID=559628 RepID=A0A2T0QY52_9ACTN|nr:amidase family protein [Kineococcus rhizosphaerae]PRY11104.1 amidase [Kineococcus rhizosphaerae]